MKSLTEIVKNTKDVHWGDLAFNVLWGSCLVGTLYFIGAGLYLMATSKPKPERYVDINNDGVLDKIVSEKIERQGPFARYHLGYEDKVLYGLEVNGRKIYLPKEQFNQIK